MPDSATDPKKHSLYTQSVKLAQEIDDALFEGGLYDATEVIYKVMQQYEDRIEQLANCLTRLTAKPDVDALREAGAL